MKLKLTILTILVALLAILSIYGVSSSPKRGPVDFALSSAEGNESFNSQGAYILPLSESNHFPIRQADFDDPQIYAKAFLLYELKSGKIVLARNPKQPLPIASLTKILTAIIVAENISPDEIITIDADSRNVDKEGADFYLGERVFAKDLLGAMLVKSSNDAAIALAKAVELRTGRKLSEMMNRKAYEIGMTNSSFFDPAGLNDDGYSTAEDLLRLVQYSKRYDQIWNLLGRRSWEMRSADGQLSHVFSSTNKLFEVFSDIYGGKTGYTEGALGCMILEVRGKADQSPFLVIILGSPARFEDTRKLIEWGQAAFRWR